MTVAGRSPKRHRRGVSPGEGLIEIAAEDPEAVERLRASGKLDLPINLVVKKAAGPFPEAPPPPPPCRPEDPCPTS